MSRHYTKSCFIREWAGLRDDVHGATAAEYALVLALVVVVASGAWQLLGGAVDSEVRCTAGAIETGSVAGPCVATTNPSSPPPRVPPSPAPGGSQIALTGEAPPAGSPQDPTNGAEDAEPVGDPHYRPDSYTWLGGDEASIQHEVREMRTATARYVVDRLELFGPAHRYQAARAFVERGDFHEIGGPGDVLKSLARVHDGSPNPPGNWSRADFLSQREDEWRGILQAILRGNDLTHEDVLAVLEHFDRLSRSDVDDVLQVLVDHARTDADILAALAHLNECTGHPEDVLKKIASRRDLSDTVLTAMLDHLDEIEPEDIDDILQVVARSGPPTDARLNAIFSHLHDRDIEHPGDVMKAIASMEGLPEWAVRKLLDDEMPAEPDGSRANIAEALIVYRNVPDWAKTRIEDEARLDNGGGGIVDSVVSFVGEHLP